MDLSMQHRSLNIALQETVTGYSGSDSSGLCLRSRVCNTLLTPALPIHPPPLYKRKVYYTVLSGNCRYDARNPLLTYSVSSDDIERPLDATLYRLLQGIFFASLSI